MKRNCQEDFSESQDGLVYSQSHKSLPTKKKKKTQKGKKEKEKKMFCPHIITTVSGVALPVKWLFKGVGNREKRK